MVLFLNFLISIVEKVKRFFFNPGSDVLFAESLIAQTDQDILIWDREVSDVSADNLSYVSQNGQLVALKEGNDSIIIFIRLGHILSCLSKISDGIAKNFLESIKKQQDRKDLDEEFNQLVRRYYR